MSALPFLEEKIRADKRGFFHWRVPTKLLNFQLENAVAYPIARKSGAKNNMTRCKSLHFSHSLPRRRTQSRTAGGTLTSPYNNTCWCSFVFGPNNADKFNSFGGRPGPVKRNPFRQREETKIGTRSKLVLVHAIKKHGVIWCLSVRPFCFDRKIIADRYKTGSPVPQMAFIKQLHELRSKEICKRARDKYLDVCKGPRKDSVGVEQRSRWGLRKYISHLFFFRLSVFVGAAKNLF